MSHRTQFPVVHPSQRQTHTHKLQMLIVSALSCPEAVRARCRAFASTPRFLTPAQHSEFSSPCRRALQGDHHLLDAHLGRREVPDWASRCGVAPSPLRTAAARRAAPQAAPRAGPSCNSSHGRRFRDSTGHSRKKQFSDLTFKKDCG